MPERDFVKNFLGAGFQFPVQVDEITGRMQTSYYEEDIREAIHIIMMTRKGERIMRPEFGCGIHNYVFSTLDYTNIVQMESEVREALTIWEPRIVDVKVRIEAFNGEEGIIYIHIHYVARNTNNPYNLVFPFYLNEGIVAK